MERSCTSSAYDSLSSPDNRYGQPAGLGGWPLLTTERLCKRVIIVGAGMSGLYLACLLGQRGYNVTVIEKRPDPRDATQANQDARSINFTLSYRGLAALDKIGLRSKVLAKAAEVTERVVHLKAGVTSRQSYGRVEGSGLFSIKRKDLGLCLLEALDQVPQVRTIFSASHTEIDREQATAKVRSREGLTLDLQADFIVGADGIFSTVRSVMQKGVLADYEQEYFAWVYKEFSLSQKKVQELGLSLHGVHVWPRGNFLALGLPNADGSMTCNLILPRQGQNAAAQVDATPDLLAFLGRHFPDLTPVHDEICAELVAKTWSGIVTMKTYPWRFKDKIVLAGDSCHAVVHFYAQGLNASLEDCATLATLLEEHPEDRNLAFALYERHRKKNTDLLAEMSKENFLTLSAKASSPLYEARHRLESLIGALLPRAWRSPYSMIAHSSTPYEEVCLRSQRQEAVWRLSGLVVAQGMLAGVISLRRRFQHAGAFTSGCQDNG